MALIREPEGVDLAVAGGRLDPGAILETVEWLDAYRREHDQSEDLHRALQLLRPSAVGSACSADAPATPSAR